MQDGMKRLARVSAGLVWRRRAKGIDATERDSSMQMLSVKVMMKFSCSSGKSSLKSDLLQTCASQCTLNTVPVGRPLVTLSRRLMS